MIGVVIWSCAQSHRVILWCDDGGPLAYVRGEAGFVAPLRGFPAVGDVVAFNVEADQMGDAVACTGEGIRHARAVRVVERGSFPGIDEMLKEAAATLPSAPGSEGGGSSAAELRAPAAARPKLRLAATG